MPAILPGVLSDLIVRDPPDCPETTSPRVETTQPINRVSGGSRQSGIVRRILTVLKLEKSVRRILTVRDCPEDPDSPQTREECPEDPDSPQTRVECPEDPDSPETSRALYQTEHVVVLPLA